MCDRETGETCFWSVREKSAERPLTTIDSHQYSDDKVQVDVHVQRLSTDAIHACHVPLQRVGGRLPTSGPLHYTMTAEQAAALCGIVGPGQSCRPTTKDGRTFVKGAPPPSRRSRKRPAALRRGRRSPKRVPVGRWARTYIAWTPCASARLTPSQPPHHMVRHRSPPLRWGMSARCPLRANGARGVSPQHCSSARSPWPRAAPVQRRSTPRRPPRRPLRPPPRSPLWRR